MRVYTGGTFDLFHFGHVRLLRWCRELAGPLGHVTVSLNSDEFIADYKGRKPIIGFDARAEVVASCRYVDAVIENSGGKDSKPAILVAHPDIIVIGSDWKYRDYHAQMGFTPEWLDDQLIRLIYAPHTEGVSSTAIRAALA